MKEKGALKHAPSLLHSGPSNPTHSKACSFSLSLGLDAVGKIPTLILRNGGFLFTDQFIQQGNGCGLSQGNGCLPYSTVRQNP